MTVTHPRSGFNQIAKSLCGFSLITLLAVTATAQIASGTTGIDATGNAVSEMATCKDGATQQSRETCTTEVRSAEAAKRAGKIDNAGGQFRTNTLKRCDVLQSENKTACKVRVAGYGNPQVSVAGGGVITQVETVIAPNSPGVINIQPQTRSGTITLGPEN